MEIRFANYLLADGSRKASASNFTVAFSRAMQVRRGVRASTVVPYDRQNKEVTVSFTVARLQATLWEAEKFDCDHANSLPGSGTLLVTAYRGSMSRQITNAVLSSVRTRNVGVTNYIDYTFTGGNFT